MIRILLILIILFPDTKSEEPLPELNKKIIAYVESVIGTQVDRGECWDLAYQALNRNNAVWDGAFKFGKLLNPDKENVLPGDIIQLKNVKVQYTREQMIYVETMKQHTAIVYEILGKNHFKIAHQNTRFSGRKVGLSEFNLNHVVKGKVWIYRPVPGEPDSFS